VLVTLTTASVVVIAVGVGYAGWQLSQAPVTHPTATVAPRADNGVVPWVDRPGVNPTPPPSPPAPAPAYAACTADQIRVKDTRGGAAAGNIGLDVTLVNASSSPCSLSGYPSSFIGVRSSGAHETIKVGHGTMMDDNEWPANLEHGGTADFTIGTSDACDALNRPTPQSDPFAGAIVGLPGGGTFTVKAGFDAGCGVGVGAFGIPAEEALDPSSYPGLSVALHAPASAAAGTTLHFTVTLTNNGNSTLRLDPCPAYDEALIRTSYQPLVYLLNCDTVHEIAPGASVTYAMQIPVPDEKGGVKFSWSIPAQASAGAAKLLIIT